MPPSLKGRFFGEAKYHNINSFWTDAMQVSSQIKTGEMLEYSRLPPSIYHMLLHREVTQRQMAIHTLVHIGHTYEQIGNYAGEDAKKIEAEHTKVQAILPYGYQIRKANKLPITRVSTRNYFAEVHYPDFKSFVRHQ